MNQKQQNIITKYKPSIKIIISFIGLLGSIASIYALLSIQKKTDLAIDIISNINVLDINANISDLDIVYQSRSLKKEKQELKLILIRIKNIGDENILKTHFDEEVPFGLKVEHGTILESPEIIQTSNSYLSESLKIKIDSMGGVYLSPVIIDKSAFFVLKLLLLCSETESPNIKVIGKIAGINKELIPSIAEPEINLHFFRQVLIGGFWVQIVKALIYFLIVAIIIFMGIEISDRSSKLISRKKREKNIEKFIKSENYTHRRIHDIIFEKYKEDSSPDLSSIYVMIHDTEQLNEKYQKLTKSLESEKAKSNKMQGYTDDYYVFQNMLKSYDNLISEGFITKEDNKLIVNQLMKETMIDFAKFIKLKGGDMWGLYRVKEID